MLHDGGASMGSGWHKSQSYMKEKKRRGTPVGMTAGRLAPVQEPVNRLLIADIPVTCDQPNPSSLVQIH